MVKFVFFYLLSVVVNFCFIVAAAKLAETNSSSIVLLCYNVSVLTIMMFGYYGFKGFIDDKEV